MSFDLTRLRINAFIKASQAHHSYHRTPDGKRSSTPKPPTGSNDQSYPLTGPLPGSSNICELVPARPSLGLSTLGNPDDAGRPCRQRDPKIFAICPRLGAEEHLA